MHHNNKPSAGPSSAQEIIQPRHPDGPLRGADPSEPSGSGAVQGMPPLQQKVEAADSREQIHPLKQLLMSDLMQYSGTRILVVIVFIFIFSGPLGWMAISAASEHGVNLFTLLEPDNLRNYRSAPTAKDLVRCREISCTFDTLPPLSKAELTFDTPLLLPPLLHFDAPEGKAFTGIGAQRIPYIDGSTAQEKNKLAEISEADPPVIPDQPYDPGTEAPSSEQGPADCCSNETTLEVDSPGVVVALRPEDTKQPLLQLRGHLTAWHSYLYGKHEPGKLRFSMIEFQPVPLDWRFAVPAEEAKLIAVGDLVKLNFDPEVKGDKSGQVFQGKIVHMDTGAESTIVEVTPLDREARRWIGKRVEGEISSGDKFPALPETIRVSISPGSATHTGLILAPLSALEVFVTQEQKQARLWIIVEGFLVPVEVKWYGSNDTHALIEESPITANLPVSAVTWNVLSNWQRAQLLMASAWGNKSLLLDKNTVIIAAPQKDLRAGAPARSKETTSGGT